MGVWVDGKTHRQNVQPNEIPTCRGTCPCSSPSPRRAPSSKAWKEREEFWDACGWCRRVRGCQPGSEGYVSMSPAALGVDEALRLGAVAPAARRLLRKRQTKDFASRPRFLCCCKLGSSSLAAAGPGPPWQQRSAPASCPLGGVSFCFPGWAGKLQQENSSPLRNCGADTTHSSSRAGGGERNAGARATGAGDTAPATAPAVWCTAEGASLAPGGRAGTRWRGRGRSRQPHRAAAAADMPRGARLQPPRSLGCGERRAGQRVESGDIGGHAVGELLAPRAARSSKEAGTCSLDMKFQVYLGKGKGD